MIPWLNKGVGGWGIPDGDSAELHCALNAGMPYFEPFDSRDDLLPDTQLKKEIAHVRRLAKIQAALCDQEMVCHRFLDETGRHGDYRGL